MAHRARGGRTPGLAGATDVHTHFVPPRLLAHLRRDGARYGIALAGDDLVTRYYRGPAGGEYADLDQRRERMAASGVSRQVLSLPAALASAWLPAAAAEALAREANDALADAVNGSAAFAAFGIVPLTGGERAARELERAISIGLRGILVPASIDGGALDAPALDPLYAAAAGRGAVVFVHPTGRVIARERLARHGLENAAGFAFEVALAGLELALGGVLERHPSLRVLLAHGGGALFAIAPRVEHSGRKLREALRRFVYDTVVHAPWLLERLLAEVGAERVAFGTDAPSEFGDPGGRVAHEALRALAPDDREQVLAGTAARLLAAPI